MSRGYAETKFVEVDGVTCLELFILGRSYGIYPMRDTCNVYNQLIMAINDAKDYDYERITLK